MAFDPRAITRDEDRFRDELRQTPDWSLASRASMALAQVLVAIPRTTYEGPVEGAGPFLQLSAQRVVGVRVFRTVRAAMAALSIGYEPEARALDRVLVELATHRDLIQGDPSGEEANRWLQGDAGRGITKKVKATSPKDLYGKSVAGRPRRPATRVAALRRGQRVVHPRSTETRLRVAPLPASLRERGLRPVSSPRQAQRGKHRSTVRATR